MQPSPQEPMRILLDKCLALNPSRIAQMNSKTFSPDAMLVSINSIIVDGTPLQNARDHIIGRHVEKNGFAAILTRDGGFHNMCLRHNGSAPTVIYLKQSSNWNARKLFSTFCTHKKKLLRLAAEAASDDKIFRLHPARFVTMVHMPPQHTLRAPLIKHHQERQH